jgi:hypothetical protein
MVISNLGNQKTGRGGYDFTEMPHQILTLMIRDPSNVPRAASNRGNFTVPRAFLMVS